MTGESDPQPLPLTEGELYVYTEEDIRAATSELVAWVRQIPAVDEDEAVEIGTMTHDLLVEGWAEELNSDD
jgi:hypothetical protein